MNESLIELQEIVVLRRTEPTGLFGLWGGKPVRAVDRVSLSLAKGETIGVIGGSGGGKSTLAEVTALRHGIDRGRVVVEGRDAAKLSGDERRRYQRRFALIRQDVRASFNLEQTLRKQLMERVRQAGLPDADRRVVQALEEVQLPAAYLDRTPEMLSGGEQQRVAIAKALMMNPLLIAADEPLSGVDPRLKAELITLLRKLQQQRQFALLLVSQDLGLIRRLAAKVAVLHSGRLFELGPTEQVLGAAQHPYSRRFLGLEPGAMPPDADMVGKEVVGCPWAPSCAHAVERCSREAPPTIVVGLAHVAACHSLVVAGESAQASFGE